MNRIAVLLGFIAAFAAGCEDNNSRGPQFGFLNVDHLDPSFETYTGENSDFIFENGYVGRIVATSDVVHDGSVSVHFDDVEYQEIRFPYHLNQGKIPLAAGGVYTFHAWVQGVDVGGGASLNDVGITFFAAYYSNATTFVSVSPETTRRLQSFGTWEELTFTFTVPAGIDRAYIAIEGTAVVALDVDLYIDDLSIERIDPSVP